MKRLLLFFLYTFCLLLKSQAQGNDMNWHFGQQVGVTFASGIPQQTPSAIAGGEGVASISDENGELLFYSNGQVIWNRNHKPMPNGTGIMGNLSSSQGVLIVPIPKTNKYYLFTVGAIETNVGDLRYTVINMDLDGGLGDVEPDKKNMWLSDDNTERLVSATGPDCNYWLITHKKNMDVIEARLITSDNIYMPIASPTSPRQRQVVGNMKFNSDDSKLVAAMVNGYVEIMRFDKNNGTFSQLISLEVTPEALPYSASFSPDGSKLYVAEGTRTTQVNFYQFDVSIHNATAINQSKTLVGSATTNMSTPYQLSDMQLGPDGVLYFSRPGMQCIGSIPLPNLKAPACGINSNAFCMNKFSGLCLPNSVRARSGLVAFSLGRDTSICVGSSLTLTAPGLPVSYLWSTGETTRSIVVAQPGVYWVQISNGNCTAADTIRISTEHIKANLGSDTSICVGTTIQLKPKEQYASYIWQDGSTGSSLPVTVPGMYWLEVTDACGSKSRDSITVSEVKFQVALGPDRQICPGESLTLQAPGNFAAVTWGPDYFITSTGLQSVQVNPPTDTVYYVRAEVVPGCYAYDTAKVSVIKTEKVQLPADTAICAGDVLQINAGPGFSSYLWHNQSVQSFISTRDQGLVWVEVKDRNGCTSRDSMVVKWNPCGYGLWLPNSFTPNGDGRNDVFRPIYKGVVTSFRISVYNRWGQVVYYSTDPDKGWDGKLEGQPLDSGTFVWVCSYQMFGGQLIHEKGTLTLIR